MRRVQLAGGAGAFVLMSVFIMHTSSAAFTATTDNSGNNWSAGTVHLTDDDSGAALFNESGLVPGSTRERCIVVTYDGSVAADVRLRAGITGGTGLGNYLDLTVRRGTGVNRDCSDFTSVENPFPYTGTLADLAGQHGSFATGVGTWAPTTGTSTTYAFRYTLQSNDAAQGKSVQAAFTWEAQSR